MTWERGYIEDYDVIDEEGNVTETLPMLVVHVNDAEGGDGAVIGLVFNTDGTHYPVTFTPEPDQEPEPEPEAPSVPAPAAEPSPPAPVGTGGLLL